MADEKPQTKPRWLAAAQAFYGKTLGANDGKTLNQAAAQFAEQTTGEQLFTVAHLLFLQVEAMGNIYARLYQLSETVEAGSAINERGLRALVRLMRDTFVDDAPPGGAPPGAAPAAPGAPPAAPGAAPVAVEGGGAPPAAVEGKTFSTAEVDAFLAARRAAT